MNEWDLQATLTQRWLASPPDINPFGKMDLVAWELMFPSWDINYKTTRWDEPSIDFVFLSQAGAFVLVELKNVIPDRSRFLSACCQVSHRAVQFVNTYSKERLQKAFDYCMQGACGRSIAESSATNRIATRLTNLSSSREDLSIYRVVAATSFPKKHEALLDQINGSSYLDMLRIIGVPTKTAKERKRFHSLAARDYDRLRSNQIALFSVPTIAPAHIDQCHPSTK